MALTAFRYLYFAAVEIIANAEEAAEETIAHATTDYGTDFRITPGTAVYQIQLSLQKPYPLSSNDSCPHAIVTVLIHHYATGFTDEQSFTLDTMSEVIDRIMISSSWSAETGVYGFQPDVDPEVSDGERAGNVITFEISASVLADAV